MLFALMAALLLHALAGWLLRDFPATMTTTTAPDLAAPALSVGGLPVMVLAEPLALRSARTTLQTKETAAAAGRTGALAAAPSAASGGTTLAPPTSSTMLASAAVPTAVTAADPTTTSTTSTTSSTTSATVTSSTPTSVTSTSTWTDAAPERIELPSSEAAFLHNGPISYPSLSRERGEQGQVVVNVWIDVDGAPLRVQLLSSSGFARLDQAALKTVMGWHYVPGKRGGVPRAMWFAQPIQFVLQAAP